MVIRIAKETKEEMISSLKDYFYNERSEEIGELAAENMLHYFLEEIGPHIYNQGIRDAKAMVDQKMMNLEEDILSLEKSVRKKRN
ncbi:DUF2164 domain-containing protein [Oceanobacillus luteolus]|uniref:DUF2164 domain-containing protein n=1 Tax=Oceanobacillus luteolus TaxID=1274358 RepID=A0ABW4HUV3_9BACI|nr:DUF2164 domain-containing protein [Oceanobacillus luteolus]MCM3741535.1 DUF2164 domain-containing protein [Oceanobacillus luteolus]